MKGPYYRFVLRQLRPFLENVVRRNQHTYSIVKPGVVSPRRTVPDHIAKPSYALTGEVLDRPRQIDIKTKDEIEAMWLSCKLARKILDKVGKTITVGMTTNEIDELVHSECIKHQAYPSPLNYQGFPKSVCTSVNNVMCHGIPDDRPLEDGDIVNVDVTVYYGGYHGDTNETFKVGQVDTAGLQLLKVGKACLHKGIDVCRPGARFCDIGVAISEYAYSQGYTVVPIITGHGIGKYMHGPPEIIHVDYETPESRRIMKPGMTFTIEPVISEGTEEHVMLPDGWTLVSKDNSRSCQFEHTVLITDKGADIMTKYYTHYEEI